VKYFVIADEDTVLGFRYAGVEGHAVRTPEEARAALVECVASRTSGIVILTDEIAATIQGEVNKLRFEAEVPLIVQVPGPDGPLPGRADLLTMIREAMGIKV
jgi:vacuolar-type H+-ATPase subunit F/Vma7